MKAVELSDWTGAHVGSSRDEATPLACTTVPLGFTVIGGLTGSNASAFPCEYMNLTSSHTIELLGPARLLEQVWPRADAAVSLGHLRGQLDQIKRRSGLTWVQVAHGLDINPRSLYFWRTGGGISAEHEQRLPQLVALIDALDTGTPHEVRLQLLDVTPLGSLLELMRAGQPLGVMQNAAPWRTRARQDLRRNLVGLERGDAIDEDFVFLLYLNEAELGEFAGRAEELLGAPVARRHEWVTLLDEQLNAMRQPDFVDVEADEGAEGDADDAVAVTPLFQLDELGISIGVGAIARSSREVE